MEINKQNGNVCFNEESHVYWNDEGKFVSVTTMIHEFTNEYDKDFWSGYKALEKLLGATAFGLEKKELLTTHKIDLKHFIDNYGITEQDFNHTQQEILDKWQQENITSCERGTKIHAEQENLFYGKDKVSVQRFGIGGEFICKKSYYELDLEKGVYPEYLVYRVSEDGKFRLAGQIDLLIKNGNEITIVDYKGLPLDTKIPTKNGWTTIADIQEGEEIFDKDGNITKVLHKSEIHYNPCYKIVFDNGESIIADHEHRWLISFYGGKDKIMTTEEIAKWLIDKPRNSYTIPKINNAKPLNLPDIELPIDPYVFGCWLGDGSKSCGVLTNINSNVWEEISNRGYSFGEDLSDENHTEMRTIYSIRGKLNELGVLNNKFIPDIYMRASYQQRLDLLRGFMDTDGYYHEGRKRFVMGTAQEWQAKDLVKLVSTLGIKATLFEVDKKCNGKVFKGWDVCFSTNGLNPFLARNQNIEFPSKDKNSFRNITSVTRVDTVATQCLEVDSPSHTFLFGDSMIVTHNTNKKLEDKSFFDSRTRKNVMMKYPLNNLMDCNMVHYTLQLSTYAWMLQMINPEFVIDKLMIVHYDHQGNETVREVDYLKDDVIRMCRYYKRQSLLKERKASRTPIEF